MINEKHIEFAIRLAYSQALNDGKRGVYVNLDTYVKDKVAQIIALK